MHVRVVSVKRVSVELRGIRLLVDRYWPHAANQEESAFDAWLKDVGPGLDAWFDYSSAKWDRFRDRYFRELESKPQQVNVLLSFIHQGPVLLISAAADEKYNGAAALKEFVHRQASVIPTLRMIASA